MDFYEIMKNVETIMLYLKCKSSIFASCLVLEGVDCQP